MVGANLAGRRVLIAGTSSGIGLAAATMFARNGALNHLADDVRAPVEARGIFELPQRP